VFLGTTFIGAIQLYVRYDSTDISFAWTIEPPLSAAFLGAGYAAGFLLTALTLRDGRWATARIAIVTILIFTWLTLLVTLVHLDRFHLDSGDSGDSAAQVAAWLWLAVYVIVPPWMTAALYLASRAGEEDSPVAHRIGGGLRIALGLVGAAMLATGAALLVDPDWVAGEWPWTLTPLTGRAIGAWLVPLGLACFLAIREGDLVRLRPASFTFAAFGALQAIALARFGDDVSWSQAGTWAYLAWLAALVAIGLYGGLAASGLGPFARAAGTLPAGGRD
jgi:hypothetical protein